MANNFTPVGNEVQVNLTARTRTSASACPSVATLTDGRFFVALEDGDGLQHRRAVREPRRHAFRRQPEHRCRRRISVGPRGGGPAAAAPPSSSGQDCGLRR